MTKAAALLGASALLITTAAVAQPTPSPPDGPGGGPEAGPSPPTPKGAHLIFERGNTRINVKCADDEPMKACADVTLQMLDELSTLKPSEAR